jgi:hypothetical protein
VAHLTAYRCPSCGDTVSACSPTAVVRHRCPAASLKPTTYLRVPDDRPQPTETQETLL